MPRLQNTFKQSLALSVMCRSMTRKGYDLSLHAVKLIINSLNLSQRVLLLPDLEKNAGKYGYRVQSLNDISTAGHYVAGIHGTRDALKMAV